MFKADIYGKYGGYQENYDCVKNEFLEVFDLFSGLDWVSFNFRATWTADSLRELQEKIWYRFHGRPHGQGLFNFIRGEITDTSSGNTWPINSWGRKKGGDARC